jgi:apolipoprotein N-acyltransferase
MLIEFACIIGSIIVALIVVAIIVGGLSLLPDWGKGLVLIVFVLFIAGCFVYGFSQPAIDEPTGTPDWVQQHQ